MLPLMQRTTNVYIDLAAILRYWREAAASVGPERVLFATNAPFTGPGLLISNVQYALDLNEEAKKLIYGGNLRRLLGDVR